MSDADRIDSGDLAYHQRVMRQFAITDGVVASWMGHVFNKYGLTPGRDRVHEDGRIERAVPPPRSRTPEAVTVPLANGDGRAENGHPANRIASEESVE